MSQPSRLDRSSDRTGSGSRAIFGSHADDHRAGRPASSGAGRIVDRRLALCKRGCGMVAVGGSEAWNCVDQATKGAWGMSWR